MKSKLIEQVTPKIAVFVISAGATTAHYSYDEDGVAYIDRLGYNNAFLKALTYTQTAGLTTDSTVIIVQESPDGTNWTAVDTATYSMQVYPAVSAGATAAASTSHDLNNDTLVLPLSGLERYIRVVATPTGATTATAMVTVTVVLGDSNVEPV